MMKNDDVKVFLEQLRVKFPVGGKEKKRFLADFEESVRDYKDAGGDISYAGLTERFGSPEEIVTSYVDALELDGISSMMSKSRKLRGMVQRSPDNTKKKIIIFIVALLVIIAAIGGVYAYIEHTREIIFEEALEAALEEAGYDLDDISNGTVTQAAGDHFENTDPPLYRVVFTADGVDYRYLVNARTGEIVK